MTSSPTLNSLKARHGVGVILTDAQRRIILDEVIAKYGAIGFRVVFRDDVSAEMVRPKKFSLFWAIVGILILYLLYYASKSDDVLSIRIAENGEILVNGHSKGVANIDKVLANHNR